jgi:hypothetical protein
MEGADRVVVMAEDTSVGLRGIHLGEFMDPQVAIPEADFMEVVEVVGTVDTLAEAAITEDAITVAIVDTITEGMHQGGPYSELF